MNDLISRAALCEYALNQKDKSITDNDIMRFPSVEAIPVEWIESKIARFKAMDNAFASLTAGQLQALLNDWRVGQNEG